jgi:hypothetical protein
MRRMITAALACAALIAPAAAFSHQQAQDKARGERSAKQVACRAQAGEIARRTGGRSAQANPGAAKAQIDAAYIQCMSR